MNELRMKHWQDPVNALLGAWLIASPWLLGYDAESMAMFNGVVAGALLLATALGAIFVPRAWEEWTEAALGLWMALSPWLLGFAAHQTAMVSAAATGLIVLALAMWVLATDKDYAGWWHDRTA